MADVCSVLSDPCMGVDSIESEALLKISQTETHSHDEMLGDDAG